MTDVYDEIEALVLQQVPGPPVRQSTKKASAAKPAAIKQTAPPAEESKGDPMTPLVALFEAILIRILGTVDDPLFSAADVATYIDDSHNYMRIVSKYTLGELVQKRKMANARGEVRMAWLLTEAGVYKYLMQAKGEKAEAFQQFVYKLLKEERKRTVDAIQLALKIERAENEELRRAKASLQRKEADLYRATNDARGRIVELVKENAKLRKGKHAAADAEYLRSMGRGHLIEEDASSDTDASDDADASGSDKSDEGDE
jgi:prophage antirepressor-like protein